MFVHYIWEHSSNLASRNYKVVVMKSSFEMIKNIEGKSHKCLSIVRILWASSSYFEKVLFYPEFNPHPYST